MSAEPLPGAEAEPEPLTFQAFTAEYFTEARAWFKSLTQPILEAHIKDLCTARKSKPVCLHDFVVAAGLDPALIGAPLPRLEDRHACRT